ncbi:GIN domain-containing protein [Acetobacter sp.]|uniref:GIN domain-containing protein n=1 Tax=Acetobacter sp. TaxID=440 RepID=UPI0039EC370A
MHHSLALPRRTAVFCALALCLSAGAQARTLPGQRVQVSAPCLSSLHVVTDSTLSDGVDIPGAWPTGLQSATAADGTITLTQTGCTSGQNLELHTPSAMPLAIDSPQATRIVIDDRKGSMSIQSGSGGIELGLTGPIDLASDSSGPIRIDTLAGSARLRSTTSAPITIRQIKAPALAVYLAGTASLSAPAGTLKALDITNAGKGNASFGGTTDVAALHVLGSGNINVHKATGIVATERDGKGRIDINLPDASPTQQN